MELFLAVREFKTFSSLTLFFNRLSLSYITPSISGLRRYQKNLSLSQAIYLGVALSYIEVFIPSTSLDWLMVPFSHTLMVQLSTPGVYRSPRCYCLTHSSFNYFTTSPHRQGRVISTSTCCH